MRVRITLSFRTNRSTPVIKRSHNLQHQPVVRVPGARKRGAGEMVAGAPGAGLLGPNVSGALIARASGGGRRFRLGVDRFGNRLGR